MTAARRQHVPARPWKDTTELIQLLRKDYHQLALVALALMPSANVAPLSLALDHTLTLTYIDPALAVPRLDLLARAFMLSLSAALTRPTRLQQEITRPMHQLALTLRTWLDEAKRQLPLLPLHPVDDEQELEVTLPEFLQQLEQSIWASE